MTIWIPCVREIRSISILFIIGHIACPLLRTLKGFQLVQLLTPLGIRSYHVHQCSQNFDPLTIWLKRGGASLFTLHLLSITRRIRRAVNCLFGAVMAFGLVYSLSLLNSIRDFRVSSRFLLRLRLIQDEYFPFSPFQMPTSVLFRKGLSHHLEHWKPSSWLADSVEVNEVRVFGLLHS